MDIPRNFNGEVSLPETFASQPEPSYFPTAVAVAPAVGGLPLASDLTGEELFREIGKFIVEKLPDPVEGSEPKDVFNDIESGVVLAALQRTRGNKQAAANLLGLYRPRLYGMIKRHNLEDRV